MKNRRFCTHFLPLALTLTLAMTAATSAYAAERSEIETAIPKAKAESCSYHKTHSRFSKVTSTFTRPEKVKNVKAKERMSSLFQIDWDKSDGASGYQLQVKPASTGKWSNYYQKADGTKFYPIDYLDRYNEKRYTKHTTARWDMTPDEAQYQFRVRAYRVVNGKKVFGRYSDPVTLKPVWNSGKEIREFVHNWVSSTYPNWDRTAAKQLIQSGISPADASWGVEWGYRNAISQYETKEYLLQHLCEEKLTDYFQQWYFDNDADAPTGILYVEDKPHDGSWRIWWID